MSYYAKYEAYSLSYAQFSFLVAKKSRRVIMNYHAKSGAYSLKIDQVMLNLGFGGHFVFWKKNC